MKLLNRDLRCGGPNGCGKTFTFVEGESVLDASVVLRTHRETPGHPGKAMEYQNRIRLEAGLAPERDEDRLTISGGTLAKNTQTLTVNGNLVMSGEVHASPTNSSIRPPARSMDDAAFYYRCIYCHKVFTDYNRYAGHSRGCNDKSPVAQQ